MLRSSKFIAALLLLFCVNFVHAQGIGPVIQGVQANLNAAAGPSPNNDATQGYQIGSLWQNANTGQVWIARSVAAGAAVWDNLELSNFVNYLANNWYIPTEYPQVATSGALVANSIRCYPVFFKSRLTISNLGIRVITTAGAGNIQGAIYANTPATNHPTGTALISTASMSAVTAGPVSAAAVKQFEAGMVWFCGNTDTAGLTVTAISSAQNGAIIGSVVGSTALGNVLGASSTTITSLAYNSQTFGTWPDLTAASPSEGVGSNAFIGFAFEVSSIP